MVTIMTKTSTVLPCQSAFCCPKGTCPSVHRPLGQSH